MSKKDAIVLASRALALLMTVWALAELSYLPEFVHSFLRYAGDVVLSNSTQFWRHYYLIRVSFLIVRIVGFSLVARWFFKSGAEVEELLLPASDHQDAVGH